MNQDEINDEAWRILASRCLECGQSTDSHYAWCSAGQAAALLHQLFEHKPEVLGLLMHELDHITTQQRLDRHDSSTISK